MLRKSYLTWYNCTQASLWSLCFFNIIYSVVLGRDAHQAYLSGVWYARIGQALAWLELLHALTGLAGGGIVATFIQNLGRSVVLFAVLGYIPPAQSTTAVILLTAWAIADVVRYALYVSSAVGVTPPWLLYLRYSLFLVLYPVGIVAEWLIYWNTLTYIDVHSLHRVRLPNTWNFAFDFGVWNRIVLGLYVYFAPFMYSYMLRQRKKKLAPTDNATKPESSQS